MSNMIDSTRTFIQDVTYDGKQIIARLQPHAAQTVQQIFGWEKEVCKISGLIVGETDRLALLAMYKDGATHTLTLDIGSASFLVTSVTVTRNNTITYQTIRPDLACTDPVYNFSMELQ